MRFGGLGRRRNFVRRRRHGELPSALCVIALCPIGVLVPYGVFAPWLTDNGLNLRPSSPSSGPPDHIRSDNGAEFAAHAVRGELGRTGVKTLYIEPGSP